MCFYKKESGFSSILLIFPLLLVIFTFLFIGTRRSNTIDPWCAIGTAPGKNIYVGDQAINLEATCDSRLKNGSTSFRWTSDIDGVLVEGMDLHIKVSGMSEGTHKITFSWEQSGKNLGSDSLNVEVRRERGVFDPELTLAPDQLFFDSGRDSGNGSLAVRNGGDGDLPWTLELTKSWIVSTALQGSAPSDITISIDYSNISPGYYEEKAIFRSEPLDLEKIVPIYICHNPNKDVTISDKCYPFRD
ncbi:hypothetical protein OAL67_00895 [bacterium]|nr:hypothetical protein [bacterium]